MKRDELDKLLLRRFEEQEFGYDPRKWEQLSADLPPVSHKKRPLFFRWQSAGIAASLLIAFVTLGWFFNREQPADTTLSAVSIPHKPITEPETISSAITPINPENQHTAPAALPASPTHIPRIHTAKRPVEKAAAPIQPTVLPAVSVPTEESPAAAIVSTPVETSIEMPKAPVQEKKGNHAALPPLAGISKLDIPVQDKPRSTQLHLTGGYNYGSLNAGYMAGVNARQRLSSKLYLEGDIAITHNQASQATVLSPAHYNALIKGTGAQRPTSNTVIQNPASLYYLQFNPSFGYQLHPRLSLSVGADLQQLLDGNNNRTLVFISGEPKLIPDLDMGITGRTEYALSQRIKAGILYREGMNNVLRSGHTYFDRRYLQVQLKLRIFGR